MREFATTLCSLGAQVLQRDWLSANQVVFGDAGPHAPSTVVDNITPRAFVLRQNRPNPFRARTSIRFELPRPGKVRLTIYDVMGRLIRTVVDGDLPAGEHEVSWDARDNGGNLVSSGVYVARIEAEGFTSTRKLLRMR